VPLGRNHARPRCTVRHGPRNARHTARARGGGAAWRWLCSVSRRRHGAGARETAGNGGSPARRRWRGATAMGEQRARRSGRHSGSLGYGGTREVVGATTTRVRRSGGRREARSGGGRRERGRVSGRVARCPNSAFKPWLRSGAWQPRGNSGARSLAIFELKITPKENSSKQIARD
jgi:hypothetical protein